MVTYRKLPVPQAGSSTRTAHSRAWKSRSAAAAPSRSPASRRPSAAALWPSHSARSGAITVGSTSRSTKARGVKCAPSWPRCRAVRAFSSRVPKIAGSTSAQSRPAAVTSRPISSAVTGSGSMLPAYSPPLKRRTIASAATEKPPAFIVRHRSATRGTNFSGAPRQRCRMAVKVVRSGSRPMDWANMQNRQRIRNAATVSGACRASSARASRAKYSAISRVTAVRRRAGSRLCGSCHTAARVSRTAGSARSAR